MADDKEKASSLRVALDFGPLLVFFAVNSLAPGDDVNQAVWATTAFMIATAIAMIVSKVETGRVGPMQWFTGIIVAVFGGMTIYLRDESFFQIKTTIIYAMFGLILFAGLVTGKPFLEVVLEDAFHLTDKGWRILTLRWAVFFMVLAVLNEVVWRTVSTDTWVAFKTFGFLPLTVVFALAQTPVFLRHQTKPKN